MFILYSIVIELFSEITKYISNKIDSCPKNSKVWALLPLIVYTVPFISVAVKTELEQTAFIFFVLTIIFYQKVERSLKAVKKDWKFKYIELWLLPFTIPACLLVGLGIIKAER